MITRVIAWGVLLAVVWVGTKAVSAWQNPWSVPAPAVLSVMPDQPNGCGRACE